MGETLYHQRETDCKKWFELCHIKDKIIWKERRVSQEKINDLTEQNKEMREALLEVGAMSHKSKKVYDWYCKNSEKLKEGR